MFVKHIADCPELTAGDHTLLREVLRPGKDPIELGYSLAHARLRPGAQSARHRLDGSEVYILTHGRGSIVVGGERRAVIAGDVVLVPAGATQHVENGGEEDLVFFCIVHPPWQPDAEEILEAEAP
jgi:mannose-6-phosphate isomerase-like protein (cupin superfamily)